jgi:hypothetical protein
VIPAYLLPVKPTYSHRVYEKLTYPFLDHYLNMKNQPVSDRVILGLFVLISIQVVFMNNSFEHLTVGFCCAYRTVDKS